MASGKSAILAVKILGDSQDAVRALQQFETATVQAENTSKKSSKGMSVSWAAVGAAMLGVVKASAATESATVALNTIFGEMGDEMVTWAEGMAQYGLSTAQAGAAAAVLGASLESAGLSTEQAAVATQGLVETSAQLAQVMGGSASEAAMAMGAALRGEYDSLERFGIALTADKVAAEAMALSQQGVVFASEAQAKAVATLSLIQQQATAILADAEAGQVTMAGATDHLKASVFNLAGAIGGALTPILAPLIEGLADTADKLTTAISESEGLKIITEALADVMAMVADILDPIVVSALELCQQVMQTLYDLLAPFVVPIVEALAAALDTVADALSTVIGWVETAIDAFNRFIDTVHEAIDSLTFWNDTYQSSAPVTAMTAGIAAFGAMGRKPAVTGAAPITVNVTAGIGDPHAIAKEIRRVLARDSVRMGRGV